MANTTDDASIIDDSTQNEIEETFGEYELGDGIELATQSANRQGNVKFELTKGPECARDERYLDALYISEEAWRTLTAHVRAIDMCLLQRKHEGLDLSSDTTLTTNCTESGDRYVRLRVCDKNGRAKNFELTYTAWSRIADMHMQITYNAHNFRRYS
jgi:hypothetical protein